MQINSSHRVPKLAKNQDDYIYAKKKLKKAICTLFLRNDHVEFMDLVKNNNPYYTSRSQIVQEAIEDFLEKENEFLDKFDKYKNLLKIGDEKEYENYDCKFTDKVNLANEELC